ncbi:MAG: type II toxin-antitoxin system VapC family toxin [Candidatus Eremiobacteraeota bacterium]|nr:type II toxin-antitoxin system VapC family toxin [Candidatus Eremiobacteraeota bacterium]MBV9057027.1 type II toxin-antitoxin system VapC family toxin [Candidatus Eremiobacteraeota bacterium]MBV9700209.1 type II toxin-antitoxin system VapC family toxin [Candidatus Eremiobacteraeota bacterium]
MTGFLLDTNVVSDLRKPRPNRGLVAWIDASDENKLFLSVITMGEIRVGIETQTNQKKRSDLETWLVSSLMVRFEGRILPFDLGVAERWGRIEGRARSGSGKLPIVDSFIAATALHHDLTLVTNNESDFARTGAAIVNPWS